MPHDLTLQFDAARIPELALAYGPADDDQALAAGKRLAGGKFSRGDFETVCRWKSSRRFDLLQYNTDDEIAEALTLSLTAKHPRNAVAMLDGLEGVAVPMASAILTCMRPDTFTVIDVRALKSLGCSAPGEIKLSSYLPYLSECRALAHRYGTDLRTLDRALWQWSREQGAI